MILDAERHGRRVDALVVGSDLHLQSCKVAVLQNDNTLRAHQRAQMSSQELEIQSNEDEEWFMINQR